MTRYAARALIAALASLFMVVPFAPTFAAAQTQKITSLELLSQTPWVSSGGTFSVRIAAPPVQRTSPSELEYAVSVHPASSSRSAFLRTLTTRPTSAPLAVITTPVADAPTDENGAVTLDVGMQDPAQPRDRSRVGLRGAGVYPVVVELRTVDGAAHARLLSHLIFQPVAPNGPRLAVGAVVPIRAPVALRADGTDRLSAGDVSAIANAATTLATLPRDGVLLDPAPETLAAIARGTRAGDRAALAALQAIATTHPVIAEPFVAVQTPEANAADRAAGLERGRTVITETLGVVPSRAVTVLRDASDARLDDDLPDRVIVRDTLLQSATQVVTAAAPVGLRRPSSRTIVTGLIADTDLGAYFANDESPVLSAHHLLADLATIYFDNPGRTRSIVVLPTSTWRPNAALLGPFLAGLASSPILEGATLDRLYTPAPSMSISRARTVQPPTPADATAEFASVRRTVASFQSLLVDSPDVAQSFRDRLLIAESAALSVSARRSYVNGLAQALTAERHKFQLPRVGRSRSLRDAAASR